MIQTRFQFPIIGPIVARHAEDAAFYWSQLDRSATSPQLGFDRVLHFNRLHDAHLAGLYVTGAGGWAPAFSALQRWQKAGEAYVCTCIALRHHEIGRLRDILAVVSLRPAAMLRGVISALAWSGENAYGLIQHWSRPEAEPVAQVAALRATALLGRSALSALAAPLAAYFSSTIPEVRAAACRAAAVADRADAFPLLERVLAGDVLTDRVEAAIALLRHGEAGDARDVLRDAVIVQAQSDATATGWQRLQAARRLRRWTMELAWATAPGTPAAHNTLLLLPLRSALTFALCQGDMANLSFVAAHTATPGVERYAGWVWQSLSGVDVAAQGWILPEPDPSTLDSTQLLTEARLDADDGLPLPDPVPITAGTATHAQPAYAGKRVLMGRELDAGHALSLLETASQTIRCLAARALESFYPGVDVNVRAPAVRQQRTMLDLQRLGSQGESA